MARERMVTRTVIVTNVEVMEIDITTANVSIKERELSGTYSDTASALKAVQKLYETETLKCVSIQTMTEKEVLYGMKEIDFIKLAKVLPPRGTKANEADETE